MKMVGFSVNDVKKVAETLLDFGIYFADYGDSYPYYVYECHCCDACAVKKDDFKHELDCPILIAQDLLTGLK